VLQGTRTYLLQDPAGNVLPTHSVSAGLDYPAVGPEHALLHDEGRVEYASVTDEEALSAFHLLGETDGILPALESAHALAWIVREASALQGQLVLVNLSALQGQLVLVNLSGRGDKDLGIVVEQGRGVRVGERSEPSGDPACKSRRASVASARPRRDREPRPSPSRKRRKEEP
jgi:tryptophan synthase beta chain